MSIADCFHDEGGTFSTMSCFRTNYVLSTLVLLWVIGTAYPIGAEPARTPYRVQAGDVLQITVAGHTDLTFDSRNPIEVRPDGKFSYPYAGEVIAEGQTVSEITAALTEALGNQLRNPDVTVNVIGYRARQIYVLGEVEKPGAYSLPKDESVGVREAIALAEGLTDNASRETAKLFRIGEAPQSVDLSKVLAGDGSSEALVLQPRDTLVIERRNLVSVVGEVENPGSYQLPDQGRISDALAMAGGFVQDKRTGGTTANKTQALLIKPDQTTMPVDLAGILSGQDPRADISIGTGDTLLILEATNQVAVLGEVGQAGSYYLSKKEKLSAVVAMAGGVTKAADLQHIHIISPNGQLCTVNCEPLLREGIGGPDVLCAPGDTVIVPTNRNRAAVFGAVASPGVYTIEAGDSILDLISKAGGVVPEKSAPEHTLVMHKTSPDAQPEPVNLQKIMEGRVSFDELAIQDDDIIFVPESKELHWQDWTSILSSAANLWWLFGKF